MQNYQFKRPETGSIAKETVKELLRQWQFWSLLPFAVISSVLLVIHIIQVEFLELEISIIPFEPGFLFIPILIIAFYIEHLHNKIRKSFWERFADLNGWQYEDYGNSKQELGIMFRQGNNKNRAIEHVIRGIIEDRIFRIFNYSFTIGGDRQKIVYDFTVFTFKFNGSFPHIYLNNKHNSFGVSVGESIQLPSEFDKKFALMAPRKYEIEALEIFTPDVLVKLLDSGFAHDVEFVGSEMLIFISGRMNSFDELEKEFKMALEIEDLLDEKLDKFKFEKIGDMPYTL